MHLDFIRMTGTGMDVHVVVVPESDWAEWAMNFHHASGCMHFLQRFIWKHDFAFGTGVPGGCDQCWMDQAHVVVVLKRGQSKIHVADHADILPIWLGVWMRVWIGQGLVGTRWLVLLGQCLVSRL